jgi:excisionase family DNA binding protein
MAELAEIQRQSSESRGYIKPMMNFKECRDYISCSPSYLYKMTSKGEIPHYKPHGKKLYFDRAEIDEWLRQGKVRTQAELESMANNYLTNNQR